MSPAVPGGRSAEGGRGCMTITPLPQVAGFDAPIGGGFWVHTDTQRPSLAKGLLQHSQWHRPWKASNRKTHLANGHSQQSRVVTIALKMAVGQSGLCGSVQLENRFSLRKNDDTCEHPPPDNTPVPSSLTAEIRRKTHIVLT
jgi:hypothetical protein